MGRGHRMFRCAVPEALLESRELLTSAAAIDLPAPLTSQVASTAPGDLFHRNGVNGLNLHKAFVNQMTDRFNISRDAASRISESFLVFEQAFLSSLPGSPPISKPLGAPAMPPTLPNLLADMKSQVIAALTTLHVPTNQVRPSLVKAPKFTALPGKALIPYALAQIDQMGTELSGLSAGIGPNGPSSGTRTSINSAISATFNAIINALAEFSLHPNLFQQPSDFYINPQAHFSVGFSDVPARSAPGFFVRGPGGQLLPGAILHPHLPLSQQV